MTELGIAVVGLLMLAGLAGIVVPILPGILLIAGAALWWAIADGGTATHWSAFAFVVAFALAGTWLKYAIPAKRTSQAGASNISMGLALVLGIVGLFVIPIVGGPIGFVLGVYLAERVRLRAHAPAWAATKAGLRGFALGMLIEFTAAVAMIGAWVVGVLLTR
ncbi:DUF456 domain-containing protein [Blastococcus sp. Marseille-P5729]|uniref:DUF456 domain-containing protein n=1 Tax=Blastococcus sp. Marseille-P5729 TaxID=2086582 RepID=UPI000D0F12CB|nr:DUF456 domain-containing protein [Blastococcus sp. Marseille-P5729]